MHYSGEMGEAMLEETGLVVERISSDRVKIKVVRSSACESCASAAACQALSGGNEMRVEAHDKLEVNVGQQVVIALPEKTLLWASFLIYILPLMSLFIGIGFVKWLLPHASQALIIAGGLGGLALGFFGIHYYSRRLKTSEYLPVVVRTAE